LSNSPNGAAAGARDMTAAAATQSIRLRSVLGLFDLPDFAALQATVDETRH
jgi:hypothetical protein